MTESQPLCPFEKMDAILGLFAKIAELSGRTFRIDLHDVVANDEHAVAIYATRGEREGRTLAWLMSDDQYAADEFFS